jgi:hypothetical protein
MDEETVIQSIPKFAGPIVLFGSGEISASGRRVYEWLLSHMQRPIRVAILETPAGFQPNSSLVAKKVGLFLQHHLQNYQPQITVVPARKRGTSFSPDDQDIVAPIMRANTIFLGPGSPTYAVRQLQDSLAWHTVLACQRQGAALVLASAATIAASLHALPVYEIYKAGEDLHWYPGLDLFGPYGLSLVFISHWNNREGGAELDTSHCYMGHARFEQLLTELPSQANIVGIDEHTALVINTANEECRVMGRGNVHLFQQGKEKRFVHGQTFSITELGPFQKVEPQSCIRATVWKSVKAARIEVEAALNIQPPSEILTLVKTREIARNRGDWEKADAVRKRILILGWQVNDSGTGPKVTPQDTGI